MKYERKDAVSALITANRHLFMSIRHDDDEMMNIAFEQYRQILGEDRACAKITWSLKKRDERHGEINKK